METKQTKLLPKLPVITVIPDANPVGRRRIPAAMAYQRPRNSSSSTWNATFCDCFCSVAPTYCCVVTCCPCTTIASVKESLGGGYERTLLYFGGLAFGALFCIGFAATRSENDSDPTDSDTPPPHHGGDGIEFMWEAAALALVITFLLGVLRLRLYTRQVLGIKGSRTIDCLSSFFCCFCVISQLHLELKGHHEELPTTRQDQNCRRQDGNAYLASHPVDTLAPYAVM